MEKFTFYNYISHRVEGRCVNDPVEHFELDAEADSFFPREVKADAEGFSEIIKYLYYSKCVRDMDVYEAFFKCWETYYKEATGKEWDWSLGLGANQP